MTRKKRGFLDLMRSVVNWVAHPVRLTLALPLPPLAVLSPGPMEPPSEPTSRAGLAATATVFYLLMAGLALLIISWADLDAHALVFGPEPSEPGATTAWTPIWHALLGSGLGLAIVLLSHFTRNLGPMTKLKREFGELLGPLDSGTIAVLAVTSAIGEELLFRAALMPVIGFWPTAILFGVLHGGFTPRLWTWTAFALGAGVLLGWLTEFTGSLLAATLCHLTVNYFNLHALTRDAAPPSEEAAR